MFNILHITFHTNCTDTNKLQMNLSVLLLLSSSPSPPAPVEVLVAMAIVASIQHLLNTLFNTQILLKYIQFNIIFYLPVVGAEVWPIFILLQLARHCWMGWT